MQEIRPLTALRGFAAIAVVTQHFSAEAQTLTPAWIPSLVPHGYMAVHFFFVLSGFIMSLTYLPAFEAAGRLAFPGFLLKRVARIVPLNLFTLAMLMVLGLLSHAVLGSNIFFNDSSLAFDLPANILMLQGIGIGTNLNGPSWSISTEFAAYFLFPVFIAFVFSRHRIVSIATLMLAAGFLIRAAILLPRLGLWSAAIGDQVLYCFTEFVLGMGAFILYRFRLGGGRPASDQDTWALLAAAAIGLVVGIDLIVALLCPFIVVAAALNRGAIARLLSSRVPYFLGEVSFSIYLIHDPILHLVSPLFTHVHPEPLSAAGALLFAAAGTCAVIPFAWLTFAWVERPGRRIVRRLAEPAHPGGEAAH